MCQIINLSLRAHDRFLIYSWYIEYGSSGRNQCTNISIIISITSLVFVVILVVPNEMTFWYQALLQHILILKNCKLSLWNNSSCPCKKRLSSKILTSCLKYGHETIQTFSHRHVEKLLVLFKRCFFVCW